MYLERLVQTALFQTAKAQTRARISNRVSDPVQWEHWNQRLPSSHFVPCARRILSMVHSSAIPIFLSENYPQHVAARIRVQVRFSCQTSTTLHTHHRQPSFNPHFRARGTPLFRWTERARGKHHHKGEGSSDEENTEAVRSRFSPPWWSGQNHCRPMPGLSVGGHHGHRQRIWISESWNVWEQCLRPC